MAKWPNSNRRNEQHAAAMAKDMQTGIAKTFTQLLHHVSRRATLVSPGLLDVIAQSAICHLPAGNAVDQHFFDWSNETRQMILAEIALRFRFSLKRDRRIIL